MPDADPCIETAYKRLALAIVVRAVRDANGRGMYRQAARRFLESRECIEWVEAWTGCAVSAGWWQRKREGQR